MIAVAQAAEARATLAAMAAETQAADAIAASEAIVAGAAAVAVRALIDAGIVQEAAAHEAVEALNAAGLMVAAADQAAAEAVAEDAAAVRTADQAAAEAVAQDATDVIVADEAAAEAVAGAAANVAARRSPWLRSSPPLPAHAFDLRADRGQAGDLSLSGKGTSRARLQETRGAQPRRGGQPGPRAGADRLPATPSLRQPRCRRLPSGHTHGVALDFWEGSRAAEPPHSSSYTRALDRGVRRTTGREGDPG